MTRRPLPSALDLTRPQHSGWACVWCGKSLLETGGTSAGIARGSLGAHVLDIEVYACPDCAPALTNSRRQLGTPAADGRGCPTSSP
ncbi:hypothetical protein [Streptomyces sp. V3I7]|uniref:hypothetical protein n=1 Tax=Streptomyces sp. V3I7 TaxID=3042278 RepID=UPI002784FD47|nr:hypothetical protein [Streptomyces sp. V3I7]MDQ0992148.1 hypothetical protein [Streptomyces sp. V3I7]